MGVLTTEIIAEADFSQVDSIAWFYQVGSASTQISGARDSVLVVDRPGIYEIRLISASGCILGTETIDIPFSDATPPQLEDLYEICRATGNLVSLDVGVWASYEWYLDESLVSEASEFIPEVAGNYELIVRDDAGCEFLLDFTVNEICEVDVRFPNALRPGDPSRNFVIYTQGEIDNLQVYIYNRWGELVYFCEEENVAENVSVCSWDGIVNGTKVPIGTYPVIVKFTNEEQMIQKQLETPL